MMYLVEKNYELKTKRVFDNIDEAIASANEWFNDYPNDYINVCEINESMKTVYECGTRQ